jgi:Plasmid pRiA4b ORF-3-like protein
MNHCHWRIVPTRSVRLDGLKLCRLERFVYEYDFGNSWIHDLRLEAALAQYGILSAQRGFLEFLRNFYVPKLGSLLCC